MDSTHRILLVRCLVQNADGQTSVRYIERSHFRMWQYLMANRHQINIEDAKTSLWIPKNEYQAQHQIFEHAGPVEPVWCLSIGLYDRELGLCNTTQRYVPDQDLDTVRELLLKRVPEVARNNSDLLVTSDSGFAILREATNELLDQGLFPDKQSAQLQH